MTYTIFCCSDYNYALLICNNVAVLIVLKVVRSSEGHFCEEWNANMLENYIYFFPSLVIQCITKIYVVVVFLKKNNSWINNRRCWINKIEEAYQKKERTKERVCKCISSTVRITKNHFSAKCQQMLTKYLFLQKTESCFGPGGRPITIRTSYKGLSCYVARHIIFIGKKWKKI